MEDNLQDRYGPHTRCFGCGPANENGLRIKSRVSGDEVVCEWQPAKHHEAFDGVLCGGVIGTLLDCHCNWTAAWTLMKAQEMDHPPCMVTAEYAIALRRPTPTSGSVFLRAKAVRIEGERITVEGTLEAAGKVTATCRGVFVAVHEGHPAFHRW